MTGIITSVPPLVEQPPGSNASNPAGLPGVTYTFALLQYAQTWTAKQTFPLGNISVQAGDVAGLAASATTDATNASNLTTGTIPAARLPNPSATTLGGVQSIAASASKWINSISTGGVPSATQPAFTDISGVVSAAQVQTVTPTWSGFHTFQGAMLINGNAVQSTFIGNGGPAYIWVHQNTAASNPTVPEIGGQFTMTSNTGRSSVVTISIASPAVISLTNHNLVAGSPVIFSTTGALPTGIVAGTTYFATTVGLTANTFQISATGAAGAAVNTSGTQSGVQSINTAQTAYKIGFTSSVLGGTNSGDIYAGNPIVQGYAGAGGNLITGWEVNVNNIGADATTLTGPTAAYGYVTTAGGSFKCTAAYWAVGTTSSWQYGFAITSSSGLAGFYDKSASSNVLLSDTSHGQGVNFFSATFTGGAGSAFISPNNIGFGSANAAGNATIPLINLDGANLVNYGNTAVTGHKFAGTTGVSSPIGTFINSRATAGDYGIQLQLGAPTAVDAASLYMNFVNPGNTIQRGQINAADSGGVGHVAYATASDERLKKSIGSMGDAIERLNKIEVHRYQGRDYEGDDYDIGFFAQNLHKAFPWAVTPSDHSDFHLHPWQVDYGRVTPLLVAALQDLVAKNSDLEKRIAALEASEQNA